MPGASDASTDGGAPLPVVPGTIDSIWKRATTHITAINATSSPPSFFDDTVALPATVPSAEFGDHQVESFQQIKDDTLITYFLKAGDTVYYRATEPLTHLDEIYATQVADLSRLFELKEGLLVETFQYTVGVNLIVNETTFTAYTGSFPPKSWPTKAIDIP
jgi:hypothetical protein